MISCGGGNNGDSESREGKGGVKYGGVLKTNEERDFKSLFPHAINEVIGHRIGNQIFEGLFALKQEDLTLENRLAESYEVNDSATVYTFKLRKGVKFQDNLCFKNVKGREFKASDVKYCFDRLCASYPNNSGYAMFKDRVKGANEYYKSTLEGKPLKDGVSGVTVIDDYTVQVELEYPFAGFLNILASNYCWIFPKEAVDKYAGDIDLNPVGTGAFVAQEIRPGNIVFLKRNEGYWRQDAHGNDLPYLDAISVTFIKEKKSEYLEFKKGNLDFVFRIPDELVGDILQPINSGEKNLLVLDVESALNFQYYGFQHQSGVFQDKKIRQAFVMAVDRSKIVTFTLQGNGKKAKYGVIPPAFAGYNHKEVKSLPYNPEKARELLAEAGFPNGKDFPELKLQLNSAGGGRNKMIAEVVKNQLKENLGIDVDLEIIPWAQHLDKVESGNAMFWREAWLADYPDPETFLNLFYGKHVPENLSEPAYFNSFRYKNAEFDMVFEKALRELDEVKRMEYYLEADKIVTEDAAVLPLYYDENYRLKKPWVKNFASNAMEYRDLSIVYLDKE